MAFLKRSKSQKVKPVKEADKNEEPMPEQDDAVKDKRKNRVERRRSVFARSKSADGRKSTERPRTANRTADRSRELQMLGETIVIREGGDTFSFPTPSPRLPPKSATFQATSSPLAGNLTPPIGVAIGSPRQAPPTWGRLHTFDHMASTPSRHPPAPVRAYTTVQALQDAPSRTPELRKKKSGWKALGSLFQRTPSKPTVQEPFYKLRVEPDPIPAHARPIIDTPSPSHGPGPMSPGSISSHHSRSPSITRGLARFEARSEADRASFMPNIESKMLRSASLVQRESSLPPPRPLGSIRDSEDMFNTTPDQRNDSPMSVTEGRIPAAIPRTPRLDLDIPNGEMERYSVMFEKLLEPRQSILERRQSKMKRLKLNAKKETAPVPVIRPQQSKPEIPKKEAAIIPAVKLRRSQTEVPNAGVPQRSVTSPHLKRMSSLKINIAKNPTSAEEPITAIHRPRPIQRSKTAPPGSVSPVAPNFSRPKPPIFASSDPNGSPSSLLYGENSLPPTPTTPTTVTDNDSIAMSSHENPMLLLPSHADKDEPIWDMLTSKSARLSIEEDRREPYPRVKSPEELERQMVQVSVARQVSVSKARRQVQKAVASKQPLKPRVVDMSKNRKSTVVLIETGEED